MTASSRLRRRDYTRDYTLVLADGRRRELRAASVAEALEQTRSLLPEGHSASLIESGVELGRISCSPEGFWAVSSPDPEPLGMTNTRRVRCAS